MSGWSSAEMAQIAAADIPNGAFVNLGIGLPEQIANFVPADREIILHSENGILGMGAQAAAGDEDDDLINAGKKAVSLVEGGAFFHHADSFAMIRGGHIDICVMGAYQVAANGDLANWRAGADSVPAVGGAMDLASGAKSVRVITQHMTREGTSKLVAMLDLPATGRGVIERVYTNLAVLDPANGAFVVRRLAPGVSAEMLRDKTAAPLCFADADSAQSLNATTQQ